MLPKHLCYRYTTARVAYNAVYLTTHCLICLYFFNVIPPYPGYRNKKIFHLADRLKIVDNIKMWCKGHYVI